jgi:hypothetical protein
MPDSTITGLSSAATVDGAEFLPIDQSGATKKVTIADLTPGLDEFVGDVGSPSTAGTKGLVPAPSAGDGVKFLKGDGTWDAPAGTEVLTTKGDLLSIGSSADRLPVGSDGQVLTADSAQTLGVNWAAAAGGGMTKIAKVVTSGSQSTITFSSIPGTYTTLVIQASMKNGPPKRAVGG